jgi:hypothetical protein
MKSEPESVAIGHETDPETWYQTHISLTTPGKFNVYKKSARNESPTGCLPAEIIYLKSLFSSYFAEIILNFFYKIYISKLI